jgi:hypothetical protein
MVGLDKWPKALCDFLSDKSANVPGDKSAVAVAVGGGGGETAAAAAAGEEVNPQEQRLISELTVEQKKALKQIISQVDEEAIKKHLWPGDTVNKYCLRLLKARKFDINNTMKMLKDDQTWRNENNWKEKVKKHKLIDVIGLSFDSIEKYVPIWHQGFDKKGRPISIQKMGYVRLPILLSETTLDKIAEFQVFHTERLAELCGQTQTESWMIIIDADNFDAKNLFYRNAFKWAAKMNELDAGHNPERLGQMLIINAPQVHVYHTKLVFL